ncbi:MAG: tripartite tricarboxylate transporter TctB family protein [Deltaproteobacteria bacterium]|nr:tripartite tricarboxylate transporter TctB family protein [Deltaproteobacteria bacterium]
MSRAERLSVPLTLIVFSALSYLQTTRFPPLAARFPKLVITGILSLSLCLFIKELRSRTPPAEVESEKENAEGLQFGAGGLTMPRARQSLIIVSMIGYIGLLQYLGFVLATLPFLLVQFWLLGYRGIWTVVSVAVCMTLAIYYIFVKIFLIMFPEGIILPGLL